MKKPQPVTLEGDVVRLEPLAASHVDELLEIARDPELWRWTISTVTTRAELQAYVGEALQLQERGLALPFVIRERGTGTAVGSTRYGNIDVANGRVEIGWTWVGAPWQRTVINTEAKLLLLAHAFDTLGCVRVEFKTDVLNQKSRNALRRIGAVEEGILRRHMITATGRLRDTVYYSVIAEEWPRVRAGLEARLAAAPAGGTRTAVAL